MPHLSSGACIRTTPNASATSSRSRRARWRSSTVNSGWSFRGKVCAGAGPRRIPSGRRTAAPCGTASSRTSPIASSRTSRSSARQPSSSAPSKAPCLAMSHMVESRDPYTAGHERRVSELATALGAELGMAGEALERPAPRRPHPRHRQDRRARRDPRQAGAPQRGRVQPHPPAPRSRASRSSARSTSAAPVAEMVLQHHERLDGSGYPRALAGAGDPPRGPHPRRRRRRRGDELAPPLPRRPRHGGGPRRGARARRREVRPRGGRRLRAPRRGAGLRVHGVSRAARGRPAVRRRCPTALVRGSGYNDGARTPIRTCQIWSHATA